MHVRFFFFLVDPFSACEYRERDTRDFDIHLILSFPPPPQMCVQKVEINLYFFFFQWPDMEKKENPQNVFFSNDTHTQQKEKRKTFFFFLLRVYVLCLAHIYLPGTRIMVTDDMDNTHKVTLLLCKYFFILFLWFCMLEFRPFEQQVWGGPFFFFKMLYSQLCPFWYVRGKVSHITVERLLTDQHFQSAESLSAQLMHLHL